MKKLIVKIYIVLHLWMLRISGALYNVDQDLKADAANLLTEKQKYNLRMMHTNPVINKLLAGERDEKFVQDYYEILKKADKFWKTATPDKIQMAADKFGMSIGQKDKWGRRYDHFGFYDPKHKSYGKTMGEVLQQEVLDRSSKDDEYPIEFMFDNRPIQQGLAKLDDIQETDKESIETGFESLNEVEKAKKRKFPMSVIRDKDVANKIEQLTDFVHIKKITEDEHRILEFFIDKKYKLHSNLENSLIFDELIKFRQVWIRDEYDGKYGYSINEYYKYLDFDHQYDVLKFKGIKIKDINI